jgi:hypothetical protein
VDRGPPGQWGGRRLWITWSSPSTRWDPGRFIAVRNGTFDPLNFYLIQAIMTLPVAGTYTVLDDVNRPDMICAAIYVTLMTCSIDLLGNVSHVIPILLDDLLCALKQLFVAKIRYISSLLAHFEITGIALSDTQTITKNGGYNTRKTL